MPPDDFSDSTLVLAGHGSTLNADSAAPVYEQARRLRERGLFGQVLETFWKQEPSYCAVLRGAWGRRVFIVPLFISEGYFTEEILPREFGFAAGPGAFWQGQRRGEQTLFYCGPVGTNPRMTELLLERAAEVVAKHPFPRAPAPGETSLFICGHGTSANEHSHDAIERQTEWLRQRRLYADVHSIFMEESPRVEECYRLAKTRHLVVVPFFISDGLHSYEEIPVMLGEPERLVQARFRGGQPTWRNPTEKEGKLVWYTPSVGRAPLLSEVILEAVREASTARVGI